MPNSAPYDPVAIKASLLSCLGDKANAYPEQTVQRFPHIALRLVELWGTTAGEKYLQDLLVCDRSDRQGFPDDVASEIFRLSVLHGTVVGDGEAKSAKDGWGDPTEVQLRTHTEALQKIADERAAIRLQRDSKPER